MSVPIELLGNVEIANVFHQPVQAKNLNFNSYVYIIYYQSNTLNHIPPKPANFPL